MYSAALRPRVGIRDPGLFDHAEPLGLHLVGIEQRAELIARLDWNSAGPQQPSGFVLAQRRCAPSRRPARARACDHAPRWASAAIRRARARPRRRRPAVAARGRNPDLDQQLLAGGADLVARRAEPLDASRASRTLASNPRLSAASGLKKTERISSMVPASTSRTQVGWADGVRPVTVAPPSSVSPY